MEVMSTPLERALTFAHAIVAATTPDYTSPAHIVATALIEAEKQREPVEVKRAPKMMSCPDRCGACGEYCGYGDKANFCAHCGVPLKWTKEKA